MEWLRQSKAPMWLRFGIVGIFTAGWKILYYTPRTHKELRISQARQNGETTPELVFLMPACWGNPVGPV
jgi:hypothetical protein